MTTPPGVKLLSGFRIKLRLALVCAVLLVVGASLRPPERPGVLAATQERPAPLLEERVERREAERPRGLDDFAPQILARGVAISTADTIPPVLDDFGGTPARDASFGVAIAGEYLITHEAALAGATAATVTVAPAVGAAATMVAFDPPTGLVLLRVNATLQAAIIATVTPAPGMRAAAAASISGREVLVPVFITSTGTDRWDVSAGAGLAAGMPIFNVAGDLLAIAAGNGTAAPVGEALPRLRAIAGGQPAPSSIGIAYQAIDERLRGKFGDTGVIVVAVVAGGPADRAGIREGDVLVSAGASAITAGDAGRTVSALPPGTAVEIQLRRDHQLATVSVTPDSAYTVRALARARPAGGVPARALFPAAALDSGGVPADASVVSIDGRPVTTERQAARDLSRARGDVAVLLDASGRRFFAMLPADR